MLAPIVLFTYNRPHHTQLCLESLQKNALSHESTLFIFSDGAKENESPENQHKILAVRQIIHAQRWCKEVFCIENKFHKGLANNIIEGIQQVIAQYGKVIVLEDDLLLSKGFLEYMNHALDFYENTPQVMQVNAYFYPIPLKLSQQTFFYNVTSSWGWATWQRAWKHLNTDAHFLYQALQKRKLLRSFDLHGSHAFLNQLQRNISGEIHTWAVKWYASVCLQGGYCLNPARSLVQNIGFDGSGIHSLALNDYHIPQLAEKIAIEPIPLQENQWVRKKMRSFYRYGGVSWKHPLIFYINQCKGWIYRKSPDFVKRLYKKIK